MEENRYDWQIETILIRVVSSTTHVRTLIDEQSNPSWLLQPRGNTKSTSRWQTQFTVSNFSLYHIGKTLAAVETGEFLKEVYANNKLESPLNNALMLDKLSSVEQKAHVST
ncbi:CLL_collapsed_G0002520.mRNA.1.CDS.1 [Saccharomyces cerevisiae]|nr:BDM_1a_G0002960.mRNA.1.CDS.1 [Saccharomyces cerevisiae]CAI7044827.1 BDM_1a_G0002960.mRNA.1.CDS.1 [Saccharomyces cerevisiae]CAI7143430.1 CLL_collapsed_G0002520.mRNA.1.CDS.1 [Saccharomyces cerevisiae]CAI7143682.1 CMF_collapsed_G0002610.mRNA.1.CDS.1 [Saccharomyces cerevisiae]